MEALYKISDVARMGLLGLTELTIRKKVSRGEIKVINVAPEGAKARVLRISESEINRITGQNE